MKILLIAGQFYPDLAGSGIATHAIARTLASRGHRVTVCVDSGNQYLEKVDKNPVFNVVFLPGYKDFLTGKGGFRDSVETLYNHVANERYDIVHVFSYLSMLLVGQIYNTLHCPVFFTFWNAPNPGRRAIGFYGNSAVDLGLARFIIGACPYDRMILGSRVSYDSAISLGADPGKTMFSYHGIDIHNFKKGLVDCPDTIESYFGDIEGELILLPGRIVKRKGVFEAVKALEIVARSRDVKLLLTRSNCSSDEDNIKEVRRLAAVLGVENRVVISNRMIRQRDMPGIYKRASVVIVPSYYEGLGFTAIEALVAGRPVVMTDAPGLDEIGISGENCLMVPPCDEFALAEAICHVLNDIELAGRLSANAARSVEGFDMSLFVNYLEVCYKKEVS